MTILKKACTVEKKAESTFSDTVLVDAEVVSVSNGKRQQIEKTVAEEVPIALSYDGTTQAVLMASPDDLIDFAYGFSLTEEFISDPDEIENIDIVPLSRGIDVQIALRVDRREAFRKRRRLCLWLQSDRRIH